MSQFIFLHFTAPDQQTADQLAKALVEERAAACVNIFPGVISHYRWEGRMERAEEIVLIAKTTAFAAVRAREIILAQHPFDTPAIIAIPVDKSLSSPAFCDWIAENTD